MAAHKGNNDQFQLNNYIHINYNFVQNSESDSVEGSNAFEVSAEYTEPMQYFFEPGSATNECGNDSALLADSPPDDNEESGSLDESPINITFPNNQAALDNSIDNIIHDYSESHIPELFSPNDPTSNRHCVFPDNSNIRVNDLEIVSDAQFELGTRRESGTDGDCLRKFNRSHSLPNLCMIPNQHKNSHIRGSSMNLHNDEPLLTDWNTDNGSVWDPCLEFERSDSNMSTGGGLSHFDDNSHVSDDNRRDIAWIAADNSHPPYLFSPVFNPIFQFPRPYPYYLATPCYPLPASSYWGCVYPAPWKSLPFRLDSFPPQNHLDTPQLPLSPSQPSYWYSYPPNTHTEPHEYGYTPDVSLSGVLNVSTASLPSELPAVESYHSFPADDVNSPQIPLASSSDERFQLPASEPGFSIPPEPPSHWGSSRVISVQPRPDPMSCYMYGILPVHRYAYSPECNPPSLVHPTPCSDHEYELHFKSEDDTENSGSAQSYDVAQSVPDSFSPPANLLPSQSPRPVSLATTGILSHIPGSPIPCDSSFTRLIRCYSAPIDTIDCVLPLRSRFSSLPTDLHSFSSSVHSVCHDCRCYSASEALGLSQSENVEYLTLDVFSSGIPMMTAISLPCELASSERISCSDERISCESAHMNTSARANDEEGFTSEALNHSDHSQPAFAELPSNWRDEMISSDDDSIDTESETSALHNFAFFNSYTFSHRQSSATSSSSNLVSLPTDTFPANFFNSSNTCPSPDYCVQLESPQYWCPLLTTQAPSRSDLLSSCSKCGEPLGLDLCSDCGTLFLLHWCECFSDKCPECNPSPQIFLTPCRDRQFEFHDDFDDDTGNCGCVESFDVNQSVSDSISPTASQLPCQTYVPGSEKAAAISPVLAISIACDFYFTRIPCCYSVQMKNCVPCDDTQFASTYDYKQPISLVHCNSPNSVNAVFYDSSIPNKVHRDSPLLTSLNPHDLVYSAVSCKSSVITFLGSFNRFFSPFFYAEGLNFFNSLRSVFCWP